MRTLERRYRRELFSALAVYSTVMLLIWPTVRHAESVWLKALIAMAPVIPFGAALIAIVRHVRDSDEFQRRLHLEALAISAAIVSFVSMAAGFLVTAKVFTLSGSVLLWVFPALAGLFGVLRCSLARRYSRE